MKKQHGQESEQYREPVQAVGFEVATFAFGFALGGREDRGTPDDRGQGDAEGHVGQVVDEAISHDGRLARDGLPDDLVDEDEIAEARTVGHDERTQDGSLHAASREVLEPPDHEQGRHQKKGDQHPRGGGAQRSGQ